MQADSFKEFLEEKRSWYKKIGKVFCPVLNEWVFFNAQGFRHLRYNGFGKERDKKQQIFRINLLQYSISVIKLAQNVSEHRIYRKMGTNVQYWRLEYLASKKDSIVVILRRVGSGKIIFYSIWK